MIRVSVRTIRVRLSRGCLEGRERERRVERGYLPLVRFASFDDHDPEGGSSERPERRQRLGNLRARVPRPDDPAGVRTHDPEIPRLQRLNRTVAVQATRAGSQHGDAERFSEMNAPPRQPRARHRPFQQLPDQVHREHARVGLVLVVAAVQRFSRDGAQGQRQQQSVALVRAFNRFIRLINRFVRFVGFAVA